MRTLLLKTITAFYIATVLLSPLCAQNKWRYQGQFNFGCNILLALSKQQKLPGLRAFTGFSISAYHGDLLLSYGPSVSIYTKTIGANLNPLVGDWQADFINTFSIGALWGKLQAYNKYMRTMHNGDYYNLAVDRQGAGILSTNFILNNHHRNQVVGTLNALFDNVSIYYYNDGTPFNWIGLGDNFDRYWTGGGGVTVHTRQNYNRVEFSFDQFTGYIPLLYEASGLLGINIPLYDEHSKKKAYNFNTSAYHLRVNTDRNFGFNAGVIGSLIDNNQRHYGIQDAIHMTLKYPLHPNNDRNRFFIGGSYNNARYVHF
ncbi:MAG: hypothetical protein QM802_03475 [Agriterribacter sp.]